MPRDTLDKLFIGLLVGAGVGYLSARLLEAQRAGTPRDRPRVPPHRAGEGWGPRRTERAGRRLMSRVERMRTAGH